MASAKTVFQNVLFSLLGLVFFALLSVYVFLSLPIFLYRWLVVSVWAPLCRGKGLGRAVPLQGSVYANELSLSRAPRSSVVLSVYIEGEVPLEKIWAIQQGWISARDPTGGVLRYPEFRQKISSWMGFPFWMDDPDFNLSNHLNYFPCDKSWSEKESEAFLRGKVEELLNQPFLPDRSPWDFHLIHGYKDANLGAEPVSVLILRFHHSLADGYSMMFATCEGGLGMSLSECGLRILSSEKGKGSEFNPLTAAMNCSKFGLRALQDSGELLFQTSMEILTPSPWSFPDGEKSWHHRYARSNLIPVRDIKSIKNNFGVSFTSVLMASIGEGVARNFSHNRGKLYQSMKKLPISVILPMGDHPKTLQNHWTATILNLPIERGLTSTQRLVEAEQVFQGAKTSTFPFLLLLLNRLFASQFPPISRFITKVRTVSSYISSFPGPQIKLSSNEMDFLAMDFAAGLTPGNMGVGFMIMTYSDYIRIAATAEESALSQEELQRLVNDICKEIGHLHRLAEGGATLED